MLVISCRAAEFPFVVIQAPEQFHGKVSEKSDIYAVGLILWECWTLRRPWDVSDDRDVWGVVFSIISDHKRPEIPPDCPKSLEALLVDCWNSDPKKRPTALELKSRVWKIMTVQSRRKVPPKELNEPPKGSTDVDSSMALADSMDDSSHDPARSSKIEIALPAKNR